MKSIVPILWILPLIFSCAHFRGNATRYYYAEVLDRLDHLPYETKQECSYSLWQAPLPAFHPDPSIDRANLSNRIVVNYNPKRQDSVRHETMHFMNHMTRMDGGSGGNVKNFHDASWRCLSEVSAELMAENLKLREEIKWQRRRNRLQYKRR